MLTDQGSMWVVFAALVIGDIVEISVVIGDVATPCTITMVCATLYSSGMMSVGTRVSISLPAPRARIVQGSCC